MSHASPLAGLLEAVLPDPALTTVRDAVGTANLELEGPTAARPLVAATLAAKTTVLVVTATGHEADDLTAALRDLLGRDTVDDFPSWETLPHERLSPRADTVARRLEVLHRLATGDPPQVVVATVRSLIQPMAPDLGRLDPIHLAVGTEHDFDELIDRLVGLAYTRVDMVEKRGEFAVRGGILDLFVPTADHPVRVEFWGDEVTELRQFAVADQRSLPVEVSELTAPPCRELLLTDDVRARAAELAERHAADAHLAEMLTKLADGIPTEGMEALIPVLCEGELELLTDVLPEGAHVLVVDPEKVRTRAHDLVRTGQEFLEAAWMAAAGGGRGPLDLGRSAYRDLAEVATHARDTGHPWWTLSQLTTPEEAVVALDIRPVEGYRGDVTRAFADLRAHTATGGAAVLVVPGAGTARRAVEQLADAEVPATFAEDGLPTPPPPGVVTVVRGAIEEGFGVPDRALVVLTETDLTGGRHGTSTRDLSAKMPSRRRNAVDPLALRNGDYVVHEQHGIGRYIEMVQRTVAGATREYLVLEYASSKRGQPGDRLFVPTDQLDQVSRYVGGELPSLNKLGGSDWKNTKSKAKRAVKQIAAELVQLYAARQSAPGHAFGADSPWQRELEDAFPFTETPDQMAAIDEVKADMR
ncbi:CarD family transcriptional regulator, partial [Actinophytocola sp.]|uniref:CarD family transcriptional regulator n=1 Tax=Actinophytocola sp. TaxID=1872138 RepID=UPI003D6C29EF